MRSAHRLILLLGRVTVAPSDTALCIYIPVVQLTNVS